MSYLNSSNSYSKDISNPPSMMVVDDEEELAYLFKELLEGSGYDCVSFTDPLLALEHFSHYYQRYARVITDLRMPGLNGIDLANRIRDYSSAVKIILVTAFCTDEYLNSDDFRKANISTVLEKPVKMVELRMHVNNLCKIC
ncbi:response regulator [Candidatus Nitrosocosmicus hydrocola]|uniref:response regulator n=1 Tax=Candidatus Nitrosocosmicus hydrocola TaxID=1826872 RepID=UPI0011E5ED2F|nr:response regulator [Candidatus Nitrosocosmicus hydrocola]